MIDSASDIVKIIGKGADCTINSIRIPSLFELNAVRLYLAFVKQVFDIDRYCHTIDGWWNYNLIQKYKITLSINSEITRYSLLKKKDDP